MGLSRGSGGRSALIRAFDLSHLRPPPLRAEPLSSDHSYELLLQVLSALEPAPPSTPADQAQSEKKEMDTLIHTARQNLHPQVGLSRPDDPWGTGGLEIDPF